MFAYLCPRLTAYHECPAGEVVELRLVRHSIFSAAVYRVYLFPALFLVWSLQVQALLEERAMCYASDDPLADGETPTVSCGAVRYANRAR